MISERHWFCRFQVNRLSTETKKQEETPHAVRKFERHLLSSYNASSLSISQNRGNTMTKRPILAAGSIMAMLTTTIDARQVFNYGQCDLVKITAGAFEQADAAFGRAVDLEGTTAVVGAPYEDTGGTDNGAVYIFYKMGPVWSMIDREIMFTTGSSQLFGMGVQISRSEEWIAVAAPGTNDHPQRTLHLYRFDPNTKSYALYETIPSSTFNDNFEGTDPALDFSDTSDYLALGVSGDQTDEEGAAYVFHFDGTTWANVSHLNTTGGLLVPPSDGERFGRGIALVGNSPNQSLLVGASGWRINVNNPRRGAIYWFRQVGTNSWTWRNIAPHGHLEATVGYDGMTDAEFGWDFDVSSDQLHVLAGASNYEDDAAGEPTNAGRVYAMTDDLGGVAPENFDVDQQIKDPELPSAALVQTFGRQVEMRLDTTMLIGEKGDDEGGLNRGAVHLYRKSGSVWVHKQKIQPPVADLASGQVDGNDAFFRIGMGDLYAVAGGTGGLNSQGIVVGAAWVFKHQNCPLQLP